jgi:hypothetical protein
MRLLNNLTRRERIIVYVTAALVVAVGVYFGYLEGFIDRYQTVSTELIAQTERLERQKSILQEGRAVDEEFAVFEGTLPKPRDGKSPDMVFSEDMEQLFRDLGLPTPDFGKCNVYEIPNVTGSSFQGILIQRVRGDMGTLTKLMKSLAQRNLKIRTLRIRLSGNPRDRYLEFDIEPAQPIRNEYLGKSAKPKTTPGAATAPESDEL